MGYVPETQVNVLRRPGAAMTTLLFLVLGAAFLTQVVPYRQILDSQRQVKTARAELASLQEENARLTEDVAALGTDAEIEKLAREKLGYVRPGETAYIVLDPPAEESASPPPRVEELELGDQRTWVERVWDFLTGADLDS